MNGNGWIKIHRNILKNPWMLRPNVLAVWVYILLSVNYEPTDVVFEGQRITLQPGQGLFKFTKVAKELRITTTTLYRVIDVLKSEKQIEKQSSPRNTVITVVNWSKYQTYEKQNGEQTGNKRETNGKQTGNLPIIKEYKELKNNKNIYGEYQNVLLSDEEFEKLKSEFPLDYLDRIEKLSEYMASTGKKYKNFLATIRNWARRDKEKQNGTNMGGQTSGSQPTAEDFERVIREAEKRRKTGDVGTVPPGGSVPNKGVRPPYPWERKPKV